MGQILARRPVATLQQAQLRRHLGAAADGNGTGTPPVTWNVETGENVLFRVAVPGLGHASPVIWADRLFLTSSVPEGKEASLKVGLYGDIAPVEGEPPSSTGQAVSVSRSDACDLRRRHLLPGPAAPDRGRRRVAGRNRYG